MLVTAAAYTSFLDEMEKISRETHREVKKGVFLDRDIPIISLPENVQEAKDALKGAISQVEKSTWSHPQVAVHVEHISDLARLGFKPTRLAIPIPGEKVFTTSWRAGNLHAHKQGPFYLVHRDEHAVTPGKLPSVGHIIGDGAKAIYKLLKDTPRVPVLFEKKALAELQKIARTRRKDEFAPGIPKKRVIKPIQAVHKGSKPRVFKLVVQHHPAKRSGDHYDIRLGDPRDRSGHSWATKKELPKPGKGAIRVYQQPTHTWDYLDFEGPLLKGYGATKKGKKVRAVHKANVPVHYATKDKVRFDYKGQKFLLTRAKKSGNPKHPTWYLINVSPKPKTKTAAQELPELNRWLHDVRRQAKKKGYPIFIVAEDKNHPKGGGSVTWAPRRVGKKSAVRNARAAQVEWEKRHGHDPDHDWKTKKGR